MKSVTDHHVGDIDVRDIDRSRQASHRTKTRIERFTQDQRCKRDWINFAEIADSFTDLRPQVSNEIARADAYRKLQQDLLEGDFEQNGRSAVRLLHPRLIRRMLQPEYFRSILETHGEAKIRSEILPYCWFSFTAFERWCAKHHLPTSPPRFQPKPSSASPPKPEIYRTGFPGRPTSMHLIRNEFRTRVEDNKTEKTLAQEARVLSEWLTETHRTAPRASPKAIKNALRDEFRSRKKTQK
jgi:hypothetical protein